MTRTMLTGWGRTTPTVAELAAVTDPDALAGLVRGAGPRGVLARGLGRSYGDAAQNAGGTVLDLTTWSRILTVDVPAARVEVQAGASLDLLMRRLLPLGLCVPVSPGTRQVTVGGAIAADVHGKNHHVDGSFGSHVERLDLLLADGSVRRLTPPDPLFWATVGGLGLTGVILTATLRMRPVQTAYCRVDTERVPDLDTLLDRMATEDDRYAYSVAWVDCLARGRRLGRSVLTRGDPATVADLPVRRRAAALRFEPHQRFVAPRAVPSGLLNGASIRAFNEAWYHRAPRRRTGQLQHLAGFFHPLDGVGEWNRVYGPRGFVQLQLVVPFGAESSLQRCLELVGRAGQGSFLAVLKRFGAPSPAPLSFPMPGWTLALDFPAGAPGLARTLDALDEEVLAAGGREYLAKDSRLPPRLLAAMYPRLDEWRQARAVLDPRGVFRSDLARRLAL